MSVTGPVRVETLEGGHVVHLLLDRPKGNVIDSEMIGALRAAVAEGAAEPRTMAFLVEGAGKHFSYGASVEEHLPDRVAGMLRSFHAFLKEAVACSRAWLAAVRGQCLGGGLEVAAFAHRLFAAPDARLGQPEIRLGVFAPAGSLLLPRRVGQAAADDLLLTGRVVDAEEGRRLGLVDAIDEDPREAALRWVREGLARGSASSLAYAVQAARHEHHAALLAHLDVVESLYLDSLMRTQDAEEGLRAFLEKRAPGWKHA